MCPVWDIRLSVSWTIVSVRHGKPSCLKQIRMGRRRVSADNEVDDPRLLKTWGKGARPGVKSLYRFIRGEYRTYLLDGPGIT